MSVQNYKKVGSDTKDLSRVQDKIEQVLEPVLRSPIIDGVLLTNISLTTGTANLVQHKLNRKILGWIPVRKRADANVWDAQDSNTLSTRTLDLRCDVNVVVDLWIF